MDSRRFYCARAIAYACCAKRSHAAPAFVPLNCLCERPPAVPCVATVHVGVGTCITSRNVNRLVPPVVSLFPTSAKTNGPLRRMSMCPRCPRQPGGSPHGEDAPARVHIFSFWVGHARKKTAWARDRTVRVMTVCLRPRARSTRQRGDWAGTPTFVTPWNNGREQSPEAVRGGSPRRERVSALMRTRAPRGQGVA